MISESLKELIIQVRNSLEAVDNERQLDERPALFELESLELEVKFTVGETDVVKGGFDIKIVAIGSEGSVRSEEVQTLRLKYRVATFAENTQLPGTRFYSNRAADKKSTGTDLVE